MNSDTMTPIWFGRRTHKALISPRVKVVRSRTLRLAAYLVKLTDSGCAPSFDVAFWKFCDMLRLVKLGFTAC